MHSVNGAALFCLASAYANQADLQVPEIRSMNARDYETLLLSQPAAFVLQVTLNRPDAANAFNSVMARELTEIFEDLNLDDGDSRAVVVTGSGTRAFCAGADLKERKGMSDETWNRQHLLYERMVRAIHDCPLPLIGAINGAAYGGGCEIAAALDFIYAAETARFAQTEVKLGIIPGAGGTQNLARALGERRSKELILTGRVFDAAEALEWGLVNAVFPQDQLLDEALTTATAIAENAPIAVRQAKRAIQSGLQMSLAEGLRFEIEAYNRTIPTADRREGIEAFNEKRKPKFTGH